MDEVRTDAINGAVRRKRSQNPRRPRPESQPFAESHDRLFVSPSPPSDDMYKASSDDDVGYDANHKQQKEISLDNCISRIPSTSNKKEDREFHVSGGRVGSNSKRSSEGVLAPANWKSNGKTKDGSAQKAKNSESHSSVSGLATDDSLNEAKVKKVKLKVGGVTRTIHANSAGSDVAADGSSTKNSDVQGDADDVHSDDKKSGLQGIPWKDFSSGGLRKVNSVTGKGSQKNISAKQADQVGPVRKSKRVPKRRVLDGEFSGDDEDDEIRYLEKLKSSKIYSSCEENVEELAKKQRKLSKVSDIGSVATLKSSKDLKRKPGSEQLPEDMDYEEEDEHLSDSELGGKKKKKQKKESVEALMETKKEIALTTRQRALQSSKDASSPGSRLIEFPNGLPPAPPRKQKEKLTDFEQQLKKAEAAQRRRQQNEKAANEAQAEAIRKILGQDSNRKKQEEKIKKRQEELAQERAANALVLASNTVRLLIRPAGNILTFSEDMGLPSLFDSKGCSYPPPRESCAGPSCTNPYKYRDSKSKLPLCSLQCYKAVQEQRAAETIC